MKLLGLLMSLLIAPQILHAIEEPPFDLLVSEDDFEIRQYHQHIAASVLSKGDMDDASSAGFRSIADYIFGNNQHTNTGESEKISMTAPVSMQLPSSDNLSQDQLNDDSQQWQVSFFMPAKYQLDTLPTPNNNQVKLEKIEAYYAAVIRFSGFTGSAKVENKVKLLQQWIENQQYTRKGAAHLARYNPPWTLPFLRRNEIIIQIENPDAKMALGL